MRRLCLHSLLFLLPLPLAFSAAPLLTEDDARFVASLPPVRVVVDDSYLPFSRWNESRQDYEGLSVDLFRAAADRLGLRYTFVHLPENNWVDKVDAFRKDEADSLLPVSVTPERSQVGLFTSVYYETAFGAVAAKARPLRLARSADLGRHKVGVVAGTSIAGYLGRVVPEDSLRQFSDASAMYEALRGGAIDFAMQNTAVFEQDRYDLELFDLELVYTLTEWPRHFAFYFRDTPEYRRLVPLFDAALKGFDVGPLVRQYSHGAEDLIVRYVGQKHSQELLVVVLAASLVLIMLLFALWWHQRRLRETEARYRALSDASFDGIVIHENAIILDCNDGLCEMTGYTREELLGLDGFKLLAPESIPVAQEHVRQDSNASYEITGLRKDGTRFPVGVRGRTIPYQNRTVRVTEFTDLSEVKRAEAATEAAKLLYDDLVSKIPLGIYLLRSKPDGSFRFEFVSSRMEDILGYTVEAILADPMLAFEAIVAEERPAFEALNRKCLSTGEPFDWTGKAIKNGVLRRFHISSTSERQPDGDLLWHGTLIDITEQKQNEERIVELLQEKELMLKEVHHRIKNNMSTVSGLLTLQGATLSDPAAVEALEAAKGRVLSMMVLYDKLYQSTDSQAVSLRDFLPTLVEEVVDNFPKSSQVSSYTNAEDIVLDARSLSSVGIIVNELLTNVMKYAFEERAAGRIDVTAVLRDNLVRLEVKDNGRGLPEGFDPSQSTGFGLSLVEMLIKHLKGTLAFSSGDGTTFVLEFPLPKQV